jgi:hypothetical protein
MIHFFSLEVKHILQNAKTELENGAGGKIAFCPFSHFFPISSSIASYGPLSSANPSQKAIKHTDSYSTHFSRDNIPLNGHYNEHILGFYISQPIS